MTQVASEVLLYINVRIYKCFAMDVQTLGLKGSPMSNDWEASLIQAINRFLDWANQNPLEQDHEAWTALELITDLYRCGLRITVTGCGEMIGGYSVDDTQWKSAFDRFSSLPFQNYSNVHNPMLVPPEEPVIGNIADDLADIYRDIQEGMSMYRAGYSVEALWHWRFSFHHHWGQHAVWAIFALHGFFFENPDRLPA